MVGAGRTTTGKYCGQSPLTNVAGATRKSILMLLLAAASTGAQAEWVEVGGNETATTYTDPGTIRKAGDMVTMWHLVDYTKARGIEGIKPYSSIKAQNEYDCKRARTRTLSISLHSGNMGNGESVGSITDPGNWRPILPDTLVETLQAFACDKP